MNEVKQDNTKVIRDLRPKLYSIIKKSNEMIRPIVLLELSDNKMAIAEFKRLELEIRYEMKDLLQEIDKIRLEIKK